MEITVDGEIKTVGPVPSYFLRLCAERLELHNKVNKLRYFVLTDAFDRLNHSHRSLLSRQHSFMKEYLHILEDRIALIKSEIGADNNADG